MRKLIEAFFAKNRISVWKRTIALVLALTVSLSAFSSLSFSAATVEETAAATAETTETAPQEIVLTAEGADYSVSVTCGAEAALPSDARLVVNEIPDYAAEYGGYLEQTDTVIGADQQISRARFFDISIVSDHHEIQPAAPVSVAITLADEEPREDEEQQVIHFGEETERISVQADDDTLSFDADGFSVYAIVYTVDFNYGEYIYCLPGGGEILLSALFENLGLEADLTDSAAAFSDDMPEGLVSLEAVYDGDTTVDWRLTSLAPFNTQHTLTVMLSDGAEIVIGVTDEAEWNTWKHTNSDVFQWRINADGTLEIQGSGRLGTGNIQVSHYPWSAYGDSIKKVVIGDGITEIGQYAFRGCTKTETVDFSNAHALTYIGTGAFEEVSTITSIDFSGCENLVTISNHAFGSANGSKRGASITTLDLSPCTKLKTIRNNAFQRCDKLESINLEGTALEEIQSHAFSYCTALKSVDLSGVKTLKNIGAYVFERCTALETVDMHGLDQLKIGRCLFEYCSALKTLDLSGDTSITTIYDYSFNGCTNLEFIDFAGCNISEIQARAFMNCKKLDVDLSSFTGVTSIGDHAFSWCQGLKEIDLSQFPDLQFVGAYAFEHCENAVRIDMSGLKKLTAIENCVFEYCKNVEEVDLTGCDNITSIGVYAFNGFNNKALTEIDLTSMKNLQTIGARAFPGAGGGNAVIDLSECTHLTSIGENAFSHIGMNYGSGKVILPALKEIKTIGNSAFNETELDLTVTDGVLDFSGNTALTSVGSAAFWNDKEIEKIDLSGCTALETIGDSAFARDHRHETYLTSVDLSGAGSEEKGLVISNKAFMRHENLTDVDMTNCHVTQLGTGGTSNDGGVFFNCTKLSNVDLSGCSQLTKIERGTFYNDSSLYNIDLSECTALTTIGNQVFTNDALTELVIPENVTSISSDSFLNCSSLQLIEWRAEDYGSKGGAVDAAAFASAGNYELRIGENVKALPDGFFRALANAGEVYFDSVPGGHVIKVTEATTYGGSDLFAVIKNDIYVDPSGVVYELMDGYARIVYCPPGIADYTVPASITADGTVYPVTEIAASSFTKAKDLKTLRIQDPAVLTAVGESAFAGLKNLDEVYDLKYGVRTTTIRQTIARFPSTTVPTSAFRRTGLTDDVTDYVWGKGSRVGSLSVTDGESNVKVTLANTAYYDKTDDLYRYLTGKYFAINVEAQTGNENGNYIHLFMDFSDTGYTGLSDKIVITDGNGKKIAEVTLRDTDDPDIKCLAFNLDKGATAFTVLTMGYPTPTTEGGNLHFWVDIVPEHEEGTITAVMDDKIDGGANYMEAEWTTERVERSPRKIAYSRNVNITGSGDPETPDLFYVNGSSWKIFLDEITSKKDANIGQDFATSVRYTDQMTLPEGISWNPKIIEAIKNNKLEYKRRRLANGQNQYTVYIDGEDAIFIQFPMDVTVQRVQVTLDEENNVIVSWTQKNPKTTQELSNDEVIFGVLDKALILDLSKVQITEEGKTSRKATEEDFPLYFDIQNTVTAKVDYTYSSITDEMTSTAAMRAVADKANPEIEKTRSGGDTQYLGDDITFTLTVSNTGAQSTSTMTEVKDELRDGRVKYLYITPENMETMFKDAFGSRLSVTIHDAAFFDWTEGAWTEVNSISSQELTLNDFNSGTRTRTSKGNTLVITRDGDGYKVVVTPEEGEPYVRTGTSIDQLFKDLHYYVTGDDWYEVSWDMWGYRLMGGAEIELPILATHKDTFQLLTYDQPGSYHPGDTWPQEMTNNAFLYYQEKDASGEFTERMKYDYIPTYDLTSEVHLSKGLNTAASDNGYDNDQILSYTVTARNVGLTDKGNLPLYDTQSGSTVLLARADRNPGLAGSGLEEVKYAGVIYYVLQEGTYHDVYIGTYAGNKDALADTVIVTKRTGRDPDSSYVTYDTRVNWYLDGLASHETVKIDYLSMVRAYDTDGQAQREYSFSNMVYLNDLTNDRLFASFGSGGSTFGMNKKIVTYPGDEDHKGEQFDNDNFTWLTMKDNTVTYKLTVDYDPKDEEWSVSFDGGDLFDELPQTFGTFEWKKDVNVSIEFAENPGENGSVELSDSFKDSWYISQKHDEDMEPVEGQYYIVWPKSEKLKLTGKSALDMYVTLTYSSEEDWDTYADAVKGRLIENTFVVAGRPSTVSHDVKTRAKAYLQKGVNYIYQIGATDSREEYGNVYGHVEYYAVLYNGGTARLYLSDLLDTMPRGFTFRSVNAFANAYSATGGRADTKCTTFTDSKMHSDRNAPAVVTDGENTVVYKAVDIEAIPYSAASGDSDKIIFRFTGSKSDTHYAAYDSEVDRYYLAPNEAIAFTYTLDVPDNSLDSDGTAVNRIVMQYDDPTGLGVRMYRFEDDGVSGVKGCTRAGSPYNDGTCLAYEGYEGLQSYVSVVRGEAVPGIRKTVTSYLDASGATVPTTSGSIVPVTHQFDWRVTVQNNGYNDIDGYSIAETMQYPYRFSGDINYRVYDQYDNAVETAYESAGVFTRPLFKVLETRDDSVILEDIKGNRHTAVIGGDAVTLTIPYLLETYAGMRNVRKTDEEDTVSFTVKFDWDTSDDDESTATPEYNQVMTIHFPPKVMSLMPKCYGVLTLSTYTGLQITNREFINRSVLLPDDLSYEHTVAGKRLYDKDGKNAGVYAESGISIIEGGGTTSLKSVTEDLHTENTIDSSDPDDNTITLADKNNSFTYRLRVTNSTGARLKQLVIADHLPIPDDHFSLRHAVERGSEYTVHFYDTEPQTPDVVDQQVTVTKISSDGKTTVLDPAMYTVEYCDNDVLDDDDMTGVETADHRWSTVCTPSSRSIRVILDSSAEIMDKDSVTVSFRALADSSAEPGETAYNGFVYWYELDNDTNMHAATQLVGVRIPDFPTLMKHTVNRFDLDDVAAEDRDFYFVVYQGARIVGGLPKHPFVTDGNDTVALDTDGRPVLTEEAKRVLGNNGKSKYTTVKLTLKQGECNSSEMNLYSHELWQNGSYYTIEEISTSSDYELSAWQLTDTSGRHEVLNGACTFRYDSSLRQTVTAVNTNTTWHFHMRKTSSFNGNSLPGAVFAFYSPDKDDMIPGYSEGGIYRYGDDCYTPVTRSYEGEEWYLVNVRTSSDSSDPAERGRIKWDYLTRDNYLYVELKAPDGYYLPENPYHIVMSTDVDDIGGTLVTRDIENRYGYIIPGYGGSGVKGYMLFGGLTVLASASILGYRYRRKRRAGTMDDCFATFGSALCKFHTK